MVTNHKKTIIIGGGGHARSLISTMGREAFAGYVAPSPSSEAPDLPYLGDDAYVMSLFSPADYDIHVAVGFNDRCRMSLRRNIIENYHDYEAVSFIAPSAILTEGSDIGPGSAVMARAVVNCATVGPNCVINTGAIVEHDCVLDSNVFVGPGAIIGGDVTIGSDVFIGAGAILRNGITIASGVSIGMGAVVTSDITDKGVYAGNPAKQIRTYDDETD